ncbi:unnamed protein product [Amoebophrya sp. A120]|nr:unnamed protein product [Amoebophrya sp. A120]|eukprot:GSA120T00004244001.1
MVVALDFGKTKRGQKVFASAKPGSYVSKKDVVKTLDQKLLDAAEIGDFRGVTSLIDDGADVNCTNHKGATPLHEAVVSGSCPTLGVLLRAGADPNFVTDYEKRTPLHRACFHKFVDVANLLLIFGADPYVVDVDGKVPGELGLENFMKKHSESDDCLYNNIDQAEVEAAESSDPSCSKPKIILNEETTPALGDELQPDECPSTDTTPAPTPSSKEKKKETLLPSVEEESLMTPKSVAPADSEVAADDNDDAVSVTSSRSQASRASSRAVSDVSGVPSLASTRAPKRGALTNRADQLAENRQKLSDFRATWKRVKEEAAARKEERRSEEEKKRLLAQKEKAEKQAQQEIERKEREEREAKRKQEAKEREKERQAELLAASMDYEDDQRDPEDVAAEQQMRAEMQRRSQLRVCITDAGEPQVNGEYYCTFFDTYRVEYRGVDDENRNLYWSSLGNEWRLCVNGYKAGNTLYRNPKVTKTKEVPLTGWLPWFGKNPCPVFEELNKDSSASSSLQPLQKEADEVDDTKLPESTTAPVAMEKEDAGATSPDEEAGGTDHGAGVAPASKKKQFLECRSILEIVAKPDTYDSGTDVVMQEVSSGTSNEATTSTATGSTSSSSSSSSSGNKADENCSEKLDAVLQQQLDQLLHFEDPLEKTEDQDSLWAAIESCKKQGNEEFTDGQIKTALECFTRALDGVEKMDYPDSVRAKRIKAVLYSNRSLVLLNVISEKLYDDARIVDVLYQQIKLDSSNALRADPGNFKAYYRRAIACRNLCELDQALEDATKVVEHYSAKNMQNPEAARFREELIEEVKAERRKWHAGSSERWNRAQDRMQDKYATTIVADCLVESKAKKWTRQLVEKKLNRPGKDVGQFLDTFCSSEEFAKLYAPSTKGGKQTYPALPVESFTALVSVLCRAESGGGGGVLSVDDKKKFLDAAEKCVSSVGLAMLADDEQRDVDALKKQLAGA